MSSKCVGNVLTQVVNDSLMHFRSSWSTRLISPMWWELCLIEKQKETLCFSPPLWS